MTGQYLAFILFTDTRSEGTQVHDPGMLSFTTNPVSQPKAPRAVTRFKRHRDAPALLTVYSRVESEVHVYGGCD
jgi:hypothetical protein